MKRSTTANFWNNPRLIILPLVLCFAAYSFMLTAPFKTLDDEFIIEKNETIRSFANVGKVFRSSFFGGNAYYRPLVTFSHMIEYHFYGLDTFYYNLTNIFLHLFSTLLVFALARLLLKKQPEALFIASLFAIHPVHWEAIANIAGRSIILCGLFNLAAFCLYVLYRREKKTALLAGSLGCFLLALLSKEAAGVFPGLLLAYEWFLEKKNFRHWKEVAQAVAPFIILELVYILWRHSLGITKFFYWRNIGENILGFLTFLRSVITDVRLFLWPVDLHFDRMQRVFLFFSEPQAVLTLLIVLTAAALLGRSWKDIPAAAKFFFCWFFIELLPVAQILVSVGVQPGYISTAEHFLYTPSVGFFAVLVLTVQALVKRYPRFLTAFTVTACAGAYFVFLFLITVEQAIYASSETTMFERTLRLSPDNSRIRTSLALSFARQKDFKAAEYHFRRSVESNPYNNRGRIGLGRSLYDQGRYFEAMQEFEKVDDPGNLRENLVKNLDETYRKLVEAYQKRIQKEPDNGRMHYSLGLIYTKQNYDLGAIEAYKRALRLDPRLKEAQLNLASTYAKLGDIPNAIDAYRRLLEMKGPKDAIDYHAAEHLSGLYRRSGEEEKAAYYEEMAEKLKL